MQRMRGPARLIRRAALPRRAASSLPRKRGRNGGARADRRQTRSRGVRSPAPWIAHVNRFAVELCAFAAARGEEVLVQGIENHAELHVAAMLIRDRDAERRESVRKVGGAVERIDDPSMLALVLAGAALLGEDRMSWERAMKHRNDGGL